LPVSGNLREEVISYFAARFGVRKEAFSGISFFERKGEIWATTALVPPSIQPSRPPGLRALRRMKKGLKPTSLFLRFLGDEIVSSRVEITDPARLRRLLLGEPLPTDSSPGYVALSFNEEVIGCGLVNEAGVKALIPTGRRRELLEIIGEL